MLFIEYVVFLFSSSLPPMNGENGHFYLICYKKKNWRANHMCIVCESEWVVGWGTHIEWGSKLQLTLDININAWRIIWLVVLHSFPPLSNEKWNEFVDRFSSTSSSFRPYIFTYTERILLSQLHSFHIWRFINYICFYALFFLLNIIDSTSSS